MPFRRLVRRAARGLAAGARVAVTALGAGASAKRGRDRRRGKLPPQPLLDLFGSKRAPARAMPKPPRRSKPAPETAKSRKARVRAQKRERKPPAFGALDALGFFLLAGLIVAWPRERSLIAGWREEGWRGLVRRPAAEEPLTISPEAADRAEPGRGRAARHPLAIPPRGWRDILLRTWTNFNNDRIMATAGGVTFFMLLAIFPALAAFVSLYGLFFDAQNARAQLALISGFVPHDIVIFIGDEMSRIAAGGGGKLGIAFAVSLLLSLWSANGALKALFDGLNVAYEQKETRGIVKVNLLTLAFTVGAIVFALIAIGGVVVAPAVLGFLHLDAGGVWLAALRWPVLLLLLALGLSGGLPLRTQPGAAALDVADAGRLAGRGALARRLAAVQPVRVQLRQLQQDLRLAGGGGRLHDLALVLHHHRAVRRRA